MIQRAVLATMYDTCCVPDCDVPFDDCDVHHLTDFDGANTLLANLGPVCQHDHRQHHLGRRIISMAADRTVTVTLADGTVWSEQRYRPPDRHRPPPSPAEGALAALERTDHRAGDPAAVVVGRGSPGIVLEPAPRRWDQGP